MPTRAVAEREQDFDGETNVSVGQFNQSSTKHSALIGLMFAAKHQAGAPPELIEPADPRVCVRTLTIAEG